MKKTTKTERPKPEPIVPDGADITPIGAIEFYRAGYSDAARDFMRGVLIGLTIMFCVRLVFDTTNG
jgi:hypothetical protein